jgi:hypothetical protein
MRNPGKSSPVETPVRVELPRSDASLHVYGRQAAVCFSQDHNRRGEPTVSLEFARADPGGGYAFAQKIAFQCSRGELAELTSVFVYPGPELKLTHRSSVLKTLAVRYRAPVMLVEMQAPGGVLAVPISPADQHFVRTWLLQRLASVQAAPPSIVLCSLRLLAEQLGTEPLKH